jgi:hypothetical protein
MGLRCTGICLDVRLVSAGVRFVNVLGPACPRSAMSTHYRPTAGAAFGQEWRTSEGVTRVRFAHAGWVAGDSRLQGCRPHLFGVLTKCVWCACPPPPQHHTCTHAHTRNGTHTRATASTAPRHRPRCSPAIRDTPARLWRGCTPSRLSWSTASNPGDGSSTPARAAAKRSSSRAGTHAQTGGRRAAAACAR